MREDDEALLKSLDLVKLVLENEVDRSKKRRGFNVHVFWGAVAVIIAFIMCLFLSPPAVQVENSNQNKVVNY